MYEFTHMKGLCETERVNSAHHVIVCGNEKGGSGKSTTAIHLAIGLAHMGFRVATIDLDIRQQTITRQIQYRHRFARERQPELLVPTHYVMPSDHGQIAPEVTAELKDGLFADQVAAIGRRVDFIVIDTPGSHTSLSAMAHRMADSLLTPINDSFIDFDVLARVDATNFEIEGLSQYALEVREARRVRQADRRGILDWVVVRNRLAQFTSRNEKRVDKCLRDLSRDLGFRIAHGIAERVIFREFFQYGLTAMDDFDIVSGSRSSSMSNLAARAEVRKLIRALHLPIDEAGRRRAKARDMWLKKPAKPAALPEIFA